MKTEPVAAIGKRSGAAIIDLLARTLIGPALLAVLLLAAPAVLTPGSAWAATFLERAQQYYEEGDLSAASVELKNALQRDPDNAEARALLGQLYLDTGNYESAEKELSRAWDLGLETDSVQMHLARARLALGDFSGVLAGSDPEPDLSSPAMQDLLVARGAALFALGKTQEAAQAYQDVLKVATNARAYAGLARIAYTNGLPNDALLFVERALAVDSENAEFHALAGTLQAASGNMRNAETAFAKALELSPGNLDALAGMGRIKLQSKDYAAAGKFIDQALEGAGTRFSLLALRSYTDLAMKDYEAARTTAESVLAFDNRDLTARYVAGISAFALGDLEQAESRLTEYLSEVPGDVHARAVLEQTLVILNTKDQPQQAESAAQAENTGRLLLDLVSVDPLSAGAFQLSRRSLEARIERAPDNAGLRAELSIAKARTGDLKRAEQELAQAIKLDKDQRYAGAVDQAETVLIHTYVRRLELNKAMELAEAFLERRPDQSAAYTMLATVYAGQGDAEKAEDTVQKALAADPDSPELVGNLAMIQAQVNDLEGAMKTLKASIEKNPKHYRTLVQLAGISLRSNDPVQARGWAEKAIAVDGAALAPRVLLVRSHNAAGDFQLGLDTARNLLEANPKNPGLLQAIGDSQSKLGLTEEAVKTYETLVEVAPFSISAHFLLARAYLENRQFKQTLPAFQRALAIDPNHYPTRLAFARFALAGREVDLAAPVIESLSSQFNDNPEVLELEGNLALARGDLATAVASLSESQRIFAEGDIFRQSVVQNLAFALWQQGERDRAQAELEKWLVHSPQDTGVRLQLATAQAEVGRTEAAIQNYRQVVETEPANWLARNELAVVLHKKGDLGEARNQAEAAFAQAGENAAVMDTLAAILLAEGDHESARPLLERARKMAPNQPDIALHLSQALVRSGEKAEARKVLEFVLNKLGDFEGRGALEAYYEEIGTN